MWRQTTDAQLDNVSFFAVPENAYQLKIDSNGDIVVLFPDRFKFTWYVLQKYSQDGNLLWEYHHLPTLYFDTSAFDFFLDEEDNIYVFSTTGGYLNDFSNTFSSILNVDKISVDGDFKWHNSLFESLEHGSAFYLSSVEWKSNNEMMLYGQMTFNINSPNTLFLLGINTDGEFTWSHLLTTGQARGMKIINDQICIVGENEGDLIIGKYTLNGIEISLETYPSSELGTLLYFDDNGDFYISSETHYGVKKFDLDGNLRWEYIEPLNNPSGGVHDNRVYRMIVDEDKNVYLTGKHFEERTNMLTMKLCPNGHPLWKDWFKNENSSELGINLSFMNDGNLSVGGFVSQSGERDEMLIIYNADGQIVWRLNDHADSNKLEDIVYKVLTTQDYFYTLGKATPPSSWHEEISLKKYENILINSPTPNHSPDDLSNAEVFPNPTNGKVYFEFPKEQMNAMNLQLLDLDGKVLLDIRDYAKNFLDFPSNLNDGIYVLKLNLNGQLVSKRIFYQKK